MKPTVELPERLGHRPALDGVRAMALGLVVVAHLGHTRSGGGSGVAVFFVLSGFLITTLLMEELDRASTLDLRAFYGRRARRLLPALAVMLAVVALVAGATGTIAVYGVRVLGAATYLSNWLCIRSDPVKMVPVSHTWSLAVEEQFYFLWPILVLVSWRRGRERLLAFVIVAGILGSLFARFALWHPPTTYAQLYVTYQRIYLGTDTRLAGLLIGAGAAMLRRAGLRLAAIWAVTGTVVIWAVAVAVWQQSATWLLGGLLATEVGAGLLVLAAASCRCRVLAWRPLTCLGELSYGYYLIHVPLFWALGGSGGLAWQMLAASAAYGLAVVSYNLVEQPFRRRRGAARDAAMPTFPQAA